MARYIILLIIAFFSVSSYASAIKSKNFNSEYVQMHDQEQIESMQKEMQAMNAKIEQIERAMLSLQQQNQSSKISSADGKEVEVNVETPKESLEQNIEERKTKKDIPKGIEKQRYDMALSALKSNDIKVAAEKFGEFIEDYPKGQFLSNAYFWYGETFFKQKLYDKAALQFLKSYKIASKGAKSSDSLYKLALSLKEIKKISDACAMLNKLEEEFPGRSASSLQRSADLRKQLKCK